MKKALPYFIVFCIKNITFNSLSSPSSLKSSQWQGQSCFAWVMHSFCCYCLFFSPNGPQQATFIQTKAAETSNFVGASPSSIARAGFRAHLIVFYELPSFAQARGQLKWDQNKKKKPLDFWAKSEILDLAGFKILNW